MTERRDQYAVREDVIVITDLLEELTITLK